jgi:hypothetical protein
MQPSYCRTLADTFWEQQLSGAADAHGAVPWLQVSDDVIVAATGSLLEVPIAVEIVIVASGSEFMELWLLTQRWPSAAGAAAADDADAADASGVSRLWPLSPC